MRDSFPSRALIVASAAIISFGCSQNSTLNCTGPTCQRSTPPPPPVAHLYASTPSGPIDIFTLPITNASTPVGTIAGPVNSGLAVDPAGRLFVAGGNQVEAFAPPIVPAEAPAFILGVQPDRAVFAAAFDRMGDLFFGGAYWSPALAPCPFCGRSTATISMVSAPVASSSSTSFTVHVSHGRGGSVRAIAFDSSGNLWTTDTYRLYEYTPPFTAGSVPALSIFITASAVAFDSAGTLYVGSSDGIEVFTPPFSPTMSKAFAISSATSAGSISFDGAGNMYAVVTGSNPALVTFSPPFSSTSKPVVTLPGTFFGVALEP